MVYIWYILIMGCFFAQKVDGAYSGTRPRNPKIVVFIQEKLIDVCNNQGSTLLLSKNKQEFGQVCDFFPNLRSTVFTWGGDGQLPLFDRIACKKGLYETSEIISSVVPNACIFFPRQSYIVDCTHAIDPCLVHAEISHLVCIVPSPCVLPILNKLGSIKPIKNMRVDFIPMESREKTVSLNQIIANTKQQFKRTLERTRIEMMLRKKMPYEIAQEIGQFIGPSFNYLPPCPMGHS